MVVVIGIVCLMILSFLATYRGSFHVLYCCESFLYVLICFLLYCVYLICFCLRFTVLTLCCFVFILSYFVLIFICFV